MGEQQHSSDPPDGAPGLRRGPPSSAPPARLWLQRHHPQEPGEPAVPETRPARPRARWQRGVLVLSALAGHGASASLVTLAFTQSRPAGLRCPAAPQSDRRRPEGVHRAAGRRGQPRPGRRPGSRSRSCPSVLIGWRPPHVPVAGTATGVRPAGCRKSSSSALPDPLGRGGHRGHPGACSSQFGLRGWPRCTRRWCWPASAPARQQIDDPVPGMPGRTGRLPAVPVAAARDAPASRRASSCSATRTSTASAQARQARCIGRPRRSPPARNAWATSPRNASTTASLR